MERIYAAEPNFIVDYLAKIENATPEERKAAEDMYSTKDLPAILTITNNTAYISVVGPLSRSGPPAIARYYGYTGASYNEIIKVVQHCEENPTVEKIVFLIDSPGGEVAGVDKVFSVIAGCKKYTEAVNSGMVASAAYWIASACDKIKSSEATNMTGSIGVVITAVDFSKAYEEMGIKVVQIVSRNAPDKRPDIKTDRGISVLQEQADALENVFMDRVAKGRNVPIEAVKKEFGKGSLLIASNPEGIDAIKVKMIDGLMDQESPVSIADEQASAEAQVENISTPEGGNTEETMNFDEFMAQNPDAKARLNTMLASARAEGVEAGKAEVQSRVDAAAKYIESPEYKGAIHALAVKVLKGDSKVEALEGAVTAYDMMKEQSASATAQTESAALPETPAEQHAAVSQDGTINGEADYQASIARAKAALGQGGK